MMLLKKEGKKPLKPQQNLLPLFFHCHDENQRVAEASREALLCVAGFLKRRDLKRRLKKKELWTFSECLLKKDKSRVAEYLQQALPYLESPQEPLREAAVRFIAAPRGGDVYITNNPKRSSQGENVLSQFSNETCQDRKVPGQKALELGFSIPTGATAVQTIALYIGKTNKFTKTNKCVDSKLVSLPERAIMTPHLKRNVIPTSKTENISIKCQLNVWVPPSREKPPPHWCWHQMPTRATQSKPRVPRRVQKGRKGTSGMATL
ncbi:hypothetical protein BTVI_76771 [Pitangus sulphuratus]|nr:hypothetical protein BTVI_76771 [Pitangus sulphuratus]